MPSRILREGILESERIHKVGPMAELFYRRLMSIVDDYGRYACDVQVLLSRCYPRRPTWADEATLTTWIAECQRVGLISLYSVNNHEYLEISDFKQATRSKSKCPDPVDNCVTTATQMNSGCVAVETTLQTLRFDANTNTNTNTNSERTKNADFENLPFDTLETPAIKLVKPPVDEWFAEFWAFYWRKVDRANALKAFKKVAVNEESKDRIIAAVKAQTPQYTMRESDKRPHAATWLNGRRYEDDPEVYQPPMSKLDRLMEAI